MTAWVGKHKVLAIVALMAVLVAAAAGWNQLAWMRGNMAARFDIARGHYVKLGYGLPMESRAEYTKILHDRYGIEFRAVAGCIVTRQLVAYVDGYDSASHAAVLKKFHRDVFQDSAAEAQKNWERRDRPQIPRKTISELFPYAGEKTRDYWCFRELGPMPMDGIVGKCGRPDTEVGQEEFVFLYHMPDGGIVAIRTPRLSAVNDATYTNRSGERLVLMHAFR